MSSLKWMASQQIIGNSVIDVTTGSIIAEVKDLQIDPETLKAAAAITSKSSLLSREIEGVPAAQVVVWGQDAVLTKESEVVVGEEELEGCDHCLSAADDIRGYEIVAEDGTRIGTLGDVVLNQQGHVMGYEVAEVAAESRVAAANWIDVKATRSLG